MKRNKSPQKRNYALTLTFLIIMATSISSMNASAQNNKNYMRIAKIVVDSTQLESYKAALKEQMKSALTSEKGVLAYSAVYDKKNPTHITILETYSSVATYEAHIKTADFKKYKAAVENMVQSLELTDVMPIAIESKEKKLK